MKALVNHLRECQAEAPLLTSELVSHVTAPRSVVIVRLPLTNMWLPALPHLHTTFLTSLTYTVHIRPACFHQNRESVPSVTPLLT